MDDFATLAQNDELAAEVMHAFRTLQASVESLSQAKSEAFATELLIPWAATITPNPVLAAKRRQHGKHRHREKAVIAALAKLGTATKEQILCHIYGCDAAKEFREIHSLGDWIFEMARNGKLQKLPHHRYGLPQGGPG